MMRMRSWWLLFVAVVIGGVVVGHEFVASAARDLSADELLARSLEDMAAGRTGDALDSVRRAVRLAPDNPIAHNNAGVILNAEGHYDLAARELRVAVHLAPDYEEAHYNLAHVYLNLARQYARGW
jgi:Tfp pilus assembly protein PilF